MGDCTELLERRMAARRALDDHWDGSIVFRIPGGWARESTKAIDHEFIEEHHRLQAELERAEQAFFDCIRGKRPDAAT